MVDGSIWTQPRSLTFYARMKLTLASSWMPWRLWAGLMATVWSSGATASLHRIDPQTVKLSIVSGNGRRWSEVTRTSRQVTP